MAPSELATPSAIRSGSCRRRCARWPRGSAPAALARSSGRGEADKQGVGAGEGIDAVVVRPVRKAVSSSSSSSLCRPRMLETRLQPKCRATRAPSRLNKLEQPATKVWARRHVPKDARTAQQRSPSLVRLALRFFSDSHPRRLLLDHERRGRKRCMLLSIASPVNRPSSPGLSDLIRGLERPNVLGAAIR